MLLYNPRHVSSINTPIFRRTDCIITASGIVTLCKRLYSMLSGLQLLETHFEFWNNGNRNFSLMQLLFLVAWNWFFLQPVSADKSGVIWIGVLVLLRVLVWSEAMKSDRYWCEHPFFNYLYCCTVHLVDSLIITQPTNALIICHLF